MKLRVVIDAQSFEVEVGDLGSRPIPVVVDGDTFMVWPEDAAKVEAAPEPASQAQPGAPAGVTPPVIPTSPISAAEKTSSILAPIPGVVISISVKEGEMVSFGQELCILEAMKMKNLIRATRAGTIGAICVTAGDQVRHSQVLMRFTD